MNEVEFIEDKFRLADFWLRLAALVADEVLILIPLYIILGLIWGFTPWMQALAVLIYLFYTIITPVILKGYVVGKKLIHIRIVQDDGGDVTFTNMILRELAAGISTMTVVGLIISICMVAMRDDRRSLHDFVAGTIVLEEPARG